MFTKKIRKYAAVTAVSLAMALSFTACGNPDSKETTAAPAAGQSDDATGALKIKKDLENQTLDAIGGANSAIDNAEKIADPNSDY